MVKDYVDVYYTRSHILSVEQFFINIHVYVPVNMTNLCALTGLGSLYILAPEPAV